MLLTKKDLHAIGVRVIRENSELVVGTTEVPLFHEINGLAQGEGEIKPIEIKGLIWGTPSPSSAETPRSVTRMAARPPRGIVIYCGDYHCSHSTAISGDRWSDDLRLSDLEPRFACTVCGKRGADVRPRLQLGQDDGQGDGISMPMKEAAN